MMERQIISKGEYRHYQIDNFISVKQYIFLRVNEKKCLVMRFTNSLGCKVNAFKFVLYQIDIKGNVICKKKIRVNNISLHDGRNYTSNKGIILDEKCVDFKVVMLCAYSDRYRYKLKNDKIAVYYVPHKKWSYEDSDNYKDTVKVKSKTKFRTGAVRLLAFLMILALILVALSPIIEYFGNIIIFNLKRILGEKKAAREAAREAEKAAKAAAKAARKAEKESSSILDDVEYEVYE